MTQASDPNWPVDAILNWLLSEGRFLADVDALTGALGHRLEQAGAPVWRLRISMRTLHPLEAAISSLWERETGSQAMGGISHGLEEQASYIGSPISRIGQTRQPFRRRLEQPLGEDDHLILYELKERGATDYFGMPLHFSNGTAAVFLLTSDRAGGFSSADLDKIGRLAAVLAPVVEVFNVRRRALSLAEAYLGPRTGRRVLEGQITRGDVDTIEAAILVSDLRGWTGLNARLPAREAVALANRYFEIIAEAVDGNGGEILKFLGDGVLAIFPADAPDGDAGRTACSQALAAARAAVAGAVGSDPPLGLDFGIGVHFGEVLYGNVGSAKRIDFTVLGQAVNIAARIEGQCAALGRQILFSEEVAGRLNLTLSPVSHDVLKGLDRPVAIYTVDAEGKAAPHQSGGGG